MLVTYRMHICLVATANKAKKLSFFQAQEIASTLGKFDLDQIPHRLNTEISEYDIEIHSNAPYMVLFSWHNLMSPDTLLLDMYLSPVCFSAWNLFKLNMGALRTVSSCISQATSVLESFVCVCVCVCVCVWVCVCACVCVCVPCCDRREEFWKIRPFLLQMCATLLGYLFMVDQFANQDRTCAELNSTQIVDLCNGTNIQPVSVMMMT